MTRDEAIKAMREGKICKTPNGDFYKISDGAFLFKESGTDCWLHLRNIFWLIHPNQDEGWEVVKEKVKKTYWATFIPHALEDNVTVYGVRLYTNRELAQEENPYVTVHSIEIEVEE